MEKLTLMEINQEICGKGLIAPAKQIQSYYTQEQDLDQFREFLEIDERFSFMLKETESAAEFFQAAELLKALIPKEKREELFFAVKLGFYFEGVPTRLTYLLNKAVKKYDTPNTAISAIKRELLAKYLVKGALRDGRTVLEVLEGLYGTKVELLTEYKHAVRFRDCYEVYVRNTDRALILPESLSFFLSSLDDIESLHYEKEGVYLGDELLRTHGGRYGLVRNEYDLRECI